MQIAVCDDNIEDLSAMVRLLNLYRAERSGLRNTPSSQMVLNWCPH